MNFEWDGYSIDVPVVCGGVEVDRLTGIAYIHGVFHIKEGVFLTNNLQYRGEVKSQLTQETFELKDFFKGNFSTDSGSGHCNLKGDKGTRYILSYIFTGNFDPDLATFTFTKAVCK